MTNKPNKPNKNYETILRILQEDGVPAQPAQPAQPQLSKDEKNQMVLDSYGNPLVTEDPIKNHIDNFATDKSKVYENLIETLKNKTIIKK